MIGIAAFAVGAYAFVVIALASSGTRLPAPSQWLNDAGAGGSSAEAAPTDSPPIVDAGEPSTPLEAERLALGQAVGTAAFVLEQTASTDGTWPASLAVTTDSSALIAPDGRSLGPLPAGAQVLYSTSSDLREFSLTLVGPLGAIAAYESTTGMVNTSLP
ncbi:hypothetical protein ACFCVO_12005 [Agromyces sp. NPDC056379]|uniref:hypothetical protein n=1 Tax=Agromyces sp. NPDC056379 TaxID=3345802 RepID=UPI0035DFE45D